jgi:DNA-directed RNA polymerase specialized sigma24 family protein
LIFDEKTPFFDENRQFAPLIKYYAKRLRDPHSEGELWGFLWLLKYNAKRPLPDQYIAVCLKNEYIRLSKKEEIKQPLSGLEIAPRIDLDLLIDFRRIFLALTSAERSAILFRYGLGYEQNETANLLKISRQAVRKNQVRGFKKIRAEILKD